MNIVKSETTQSVIKDARHSHVYPTQSCGYGWGWGSFGALLGLLGGIASAILGSVFTAVTWITGATGNGIFMHTLGTDFLLLTIPLLLFGGVCLDLEDKSNNKSKERDIHEHN